MLAEAALESVRGAELGADGACVASSVLPLGEIPLLREVVLVVGNGQREGDVGATLTMLAAQMRVPSVAHQAGMPTLMMVWNSGRKMSPPLFFKGADGLYHVEPRLLAAVRAQTLKVCRCGARYKAGETCYLCPSRRLWDAETLHLFRRHCGESDGQRPS